MAKKIIKAQMKQRRDTLENWAAANPVLLDGELGFIEGFNDRFKVGDGKTGWNDLSYFSSSFNPAGTYPQLTAGDLAGRGESVPAEFGFRASGGKSIKDGRAYIKRIKGNSVVWNQLAKEINATNWGVYNSTFALPTFSNGEINVAVPDITLTGYRVGIALKASQSIVIGHIYLAVGEIKCAVPCRFTIEVKKLSVTFGEVATTWTPLSVFVTSDQASTRCIISPQGTFTESANSYSVRGVHLFDLTQMFGVGNEPTTIEEFYARVATLGVDLNAYNEGEVIHCNTESIKSVGDNAWDEEWEQGSIADNNGDLTSSSSTIRSKNYIKAIGGNEYYFGYFGNAVTGCRVHYYDAEKKWIGDIAKTVNVKSFVPPLNCAYMKFRMGDGYGTTYKNDITISLYHSGWKAEVDNTYKPYWQDTLPLPIIRKYFPDGMKKAGTAHDEIRYNKQSGKWEYSKGRMKEVDMGTLNFKYVLERFLVKIPTMPTNGGILCAKYSATTESTNAPDKSISNGAYYDYNTIAIKDTSYTDAASFKDAMQGVILYYESNDWEWVELDAEDQNFRDYYNVADFGTEMSQSSVPSAPFSADIIYQFNAVDMIREHELEITELQSIIATMQAQLTSLINGGQ